MIAITLVLIIVPILAFIWLLIRFDRYVFTRFQHRFFTPRAWVLSFVIAVSLCGGHRLWLSARLLHGDQVNGIVLMTVGVIAAMAVLFRNVRRTNTFVGVLGSIFQALTAPLGALIAVLFVLAYTDARPVIVLNEK